MAMTTAPRQHLLRRGVWLEVAIIVWNVLEGIIALAAGLLASSVALIAFGIDSFVEVTSAAVVLWRLHRERQGQTETETERLERRARQIAGTLLMLLAVYVTIDAGRRLLGYGAEAEESLAGMVMTALSLVVMPVLGWAKLRTAQELGSGALRADSFQTIACSWLSLTTLVGLVLNAALGWTWADPVAALVIVPLVAREGWDAWHGRGCHACGCH